VPGIVGERPPFEEEARHPDGELVGHGEHLAAVGHEVEGGAHRPGDAGDLRLVGLAPGGPEGVEVPHPVPGVGEAQPVGVDREALEVVLRLDEPVVGAQGHPERAGDRRRGLLRALEGGGEDGTDVVPAGVEHLGHPLRHGTAAVREGEAGQAAVEDALGVVDLTVAHEVDRRECHGPSLADLSRRSQTSPSFAMMAPRDSISARESRSKIC